MKYNNTVFNKEVRAYSNALRGKIKDKLMFVVLELKDERAFYSIAPLSRAVHNLGGEMHVVVKKGKSEALRIMTDLWETNKARKQKVKHKTVNALDEYIKSVNKRTKSKYFEHLFDAPQFLLFAHRDGFKGGLSLPFHFKWHKNFRTKELMQTCRRIWKQGYNLRKNDRLSLGFVLVPSHKHTELPLEDYLDSYSIARSMAKAALRFGCKVSMGATTDKFSVLARPVRSSDLMATIRGCEIDKNITEEVFKKFKILSKELRIDRLKLPSAGFGIHAKGFHGKHFFGESIGYPTLNKKSRWLSPGQMMLKDRYAPQSQFEKRDPVMRYAITETLPISTFILTCNVDYTKIRARSTVIKNIMNKCDYVRVKGKKFKGYRTDFKVYLKDKKGNQREFTAQDSDVRTIIDKEFFKKTGKKCGAYANFPSGETFTTPEKLEGTFIGDLVINIDRSYRIPPGAPLIIKVDGYKGYKVLKGAKSIHNAMKKQWKEVRQKIRNMEKSGGIPKSLTDMYKKNFWNIGEFAINTNPKAKISDYLIVNEKIAKMIHIALGMGFSPERATAYHWDIVVNSPKQKLDIYGVDKKGKEHWVIRKGKFVV